MKTLTKSVAFQAACLSIYGYESECDGTDWVATGGGGLMGGQFVYFYECQASCNDQNWCDEGEWTWG